MRRSSDRILTTHCGSLPRPPATLGLLATREMGGEVPGDAFAEAVREATRELVRGQADAGITVINDGEAGKFSFASYQYHRLSGIELKLTSRPGRLGVPVSNWAEAEEYPDYFRHWPFGAAVPEADEQGRVPAFVCVGPVAYQGEDELQRDISNLRTAAEGTGAVDLFMSCAPPVGGPGSEAANEYYPDEDEFATAVADAMATEYRIIADAGIVVQIDCNYGVLSRIGLPPAQARTVIAKSIEVINYATRDVDPDMMRIHLCWGADEAPHDHDLPLPEILDLMLAARPNGLTVVAANGRHEWEWRVWEDVRLPDGKVIIPGVIDSTTNIIEHPETVAERISRFAKILGKENIVAGLDCGLSTIAGNQQVDPQIAWAKLRALSSGAALASQRLG